MKKTIHSKQAQIIARNIKSMRENAGLTSRQLSKILGKGHSFISNCEVGERRVDILEFYWICKTCNTSFTDEILKLGHSFDKV